MIKKKPLIGLPSICISNMIATCFVKIAHSSSTVQYLKRIAIYLALSNVIKKNIILPFTGPD